MSYTVVVATTDLGPSNSKTWKDTNIGINKEQKKIILHIQVTIILKYLFLLMDLICSNLLETIIWITDF